jgi:hypothetical protein
VLPVLVEAVLTSDPTRIVTATVQVVGQTSGVILIANTTSAPGGTLNATWSGIGTPTVKDWLGLYAAGAPDTAYLAWRYTTGTTSGSVPLALPSSLNPGTYELRLFANNDYTRLATSNTFKVAALSVTPTVIASAGTLTVAWSGIAIPTLSDWIGLYAPGAPDTAYLAYRYTTGTASGSVAFILPQGVGAGTYQLRLFADSGYTRLATSNAFKVAALSVSPTVIAAGGTLTVTWSIETATSTDWIGLYAPGAPDTAYLAYRYTTGTASGSVAFTLPTSLSPGTYELRLFANNGYTRLVTSNAFTVP